jgi:hypothetical protein
MLKLLITQFLLVFYLFVSSGFQIKIHYCGGKISALSLFSHFGDPCSCGDEGEEKADSCCKDEVKAVKFNPSSLLASIPKIVIPDFCFKFISFEVFDILNAEIKLFHSYWHFGGVSPPKIKKCILFNQLKIFSEWFKI